MERVTQKSKIRAHLQSGQSITPIDALERYGCFRLAAIIHTLKNDYGIPIASGLYIIHVNAPGIGEKIIKWFGALRPIDMDTF